MMMKLVEENVGLGELAQKGQAPRDVLYRISRFQGIAEGSGLPIPGLFRIEGSIDFHSFEDSPNWIDIPLTLKLQDGRSLPITVVDNSGRVLSEGHGPLKCMCC
jgi:hypothetical protein